MKQLRAIIIIALASAVTGLLHADIGHLYSGNQMSSSLIECVTQDKYGFLWVGTEYGLNKFDGYRFTSYFSDPKDSTSLVNNEVVRLLSDSQGRFWVGMGKGLARFDYEKNQFQRYHFPISELPRVNSLIETANGDILIGTAGFGLFSIRKGENHITQEKAFRKRPVEDYFSRVFEDDQHNIWRSSHLNVLTRFTVRNRKPTALKDFTSPYGLPIGYLKSDDGGFLVVCISGILRYDYATGQLTDAGYDLSALPPQVSIKRALRSSQGNIYIATSGNGLMVIPHHSNVLRPVESYSGRFNLATSNIVDLIEDKDHNLWLGCYQKGLFQLNQGEDAFSSWNFSEQNYVLGSSVSSIESETDNGDLLCTVQNNGLYRFDRQGKILGRLPTPSGVNFIYHDRQGHWWLSTSNALYAYDPTTGVSQQRLTFDGWGVNCMTDDGQGHLYICNFGKGMVIYDIASGETTKVFMQNHDGIGNTLCNDWIKTLFIDRYGMLWIGTSNGISCMDIKTRRFKQFGKGVLLKGYMCTSFGELRQGNILMGTNNGLFIYDRIKNQWSEFPEAENLRNKQIYGIVTDHEGDLWLSTSMGIWQYSQKRKQFIPHINGNGLTNREYVQNAVAQTHDGLIAFGTNDGITVFRPETVKNSSMEMGEVYLTNFIIGNQLLNCLDDHFEIPYDESTFTMEFSLLNYKNTQNITFEYRINGAEEWTSTNEGQNAISFNKMKPGKYVIDVRAVSNGQVSEGVKTITVIVKNPWYASPWAYLFYALFFAGLIVMGIYWFERRRKADLEESKMRFLINATHDIRSPLTLIMGPLKKLKMRVSDEESLEDIETIDRNAQRLMQLVNQILDERKIDKNQMKLHCRETDLTTFVRGIFKLYEYNAQQRNIKYTFTANSSVGDHDQTENGADHQPKIMAWVDRINFDKVISNLLSNAFKYTFDGGEINVELTEEEKQIVIKVRDNGIGLDEDKPERLFDRFYQGSNSRDLHLDGTGIGLNLSKAIVNMHGGEIGAMNREDGIRGTVLTITLKKGNSHLKPEEIETKDEMGDLKSSAKKQASKNFRILIADDDAEIAGYIRNELGNWYRFDAAPNGKEALKALLTGNYDLVISDVLMPEMDGITLLKKIKGNPNISDIPVIMLTSKTEVSDRLEGLKRGADAYLSKPFNMDELHILIDNLIDNVRRLRGKFSGAQNQEEKVVKVEVKSNNDNLMDRIMKCINENLSDPDFNVEKLTEQVGISRAQLHRKMKEITGISTGDFIRNLRLEQAARLIAENKINVTQVAYAVGFNNQTHFSTVFKKHYGMTPTEYQNLKNKKEA